MIDHIITTEYYDEELRHMYRSEVRFDKSKLSTNEIQVIITPAQAIKNRMDLYDIDDPYQAFIAILREDYAFHNLAHRELPIVDDGEGGKRRISCRELSPSERMQYTGAGTGVAVKGIDVSKVPPSVRLLKRAVRPEMRANNNSK